MFRDKSADDGLLNRKELIPAKRSKDGRIDPTTIAGIIGGRGSSNLPEWIPKISPGT
jgi:hypothetical protein